MKPRAMAVRLALCRSERRAHGGGPALHTSPSLGHTHIPSMAFLLSFKHRSQETLETQVL